MTNIWRLNIFCFTKSLGQKSLENQWQLKAWHWLSARENYWVNDFITSAEIQCCILEIDFSEKQRREQELHDVKMKIFRKYFEILEGHGIFHGKFEFAHLCICFFKQCRPEIGSHNGFGNVLCFHWFKWRIWGHQ